MGKKWNKVKEWTCDHVVEIGVGAVGVVCFGGGIYFGMKLADVSWQPKAQYLIGVAGEHGSQACAATIAKNLPEVDTMLCKAANANPDAWNVLDAFMADRRMLDISTDVIINGRKAKIFKEAKI